MSYNIINSVHPGHVILFEYDGELGWAECTDVEMYSEDLNILHDYEFKQYGDNDAYTRFSFSRILVKDFNYDMNGKPFMIKERIMSLADARISHPEYFI